MMDEQEVLPLEDGEVANQRIPLGMLNYRLLTQEIVDQAASRKLVARIGQNVSRFRDAVGFHIDIGGHRAWIGSGVRVIYIGIETG